MVFYKFQDTPATPPQIRRAVVVNFLTVLECPHTIGVAVYPSGLWRDLTFNLFESAAKVAFH